MDSKGQRERSVSEPYPASFNYSIMQAILISGIRQGSYTHA